MVRYMLLVLHNNIFSYFSFFFHFSFHWPIFYSTWFLKSSLKEARHTIFFFFFAWNRQCYVTSNVTKPTRSNEITFEGAHAALQAGRQAASPADPTVWAPPTIHHPPTHHPPTQPTHSPGCLLPWVVEPTPSCSTPHRQWSRGSPVRFRLSYDCDSASRLRAGEPSGASRRCTQWILNRMRLHSGTALRSPLSLPVMPNTINSIILLCQMYSATLSGHSLSQRPHPDVQACVHTVHYRQTLDFYSPTQ